MRGTPPNLNSGIGNPFGNCTCPRKYELLHGSCVIMLFLWEKIFFTDVSALKANVLLDVTLSNLKSISFLNVRSNKHLGLDLIYLSELMAKAS